MVTLVHPSRRDNMNPHVYAKASLVLLEKSKIAEVLLKAAKDRLLVA